MAKENIMKKNIYSNIPEDLPDELIDILIENKDVTIERIVSRGHTSPHDFWYDQDKNEFVLLVSGEAKLRFEDSEECIRMKKGDYCLIPAHKRHRVEWTVPYENTVWLTVHF